VASLIDRAVLEGTDPAVLLIDRAALEETGPAASAIDRVALEDPAASVIDRVVLEDPAASATDPGGPIGLAPAVAANNGGPVAIGLLGEIVLAVSVIAGPVTAIGPTGETGRTGRTDRAGATTLSVVVSATIGTRTIGTSSTMLTSTGRGVTTPINPIGQVGILAIGTIGVPVPPHGMARALSRVVRRAG